MTVQKFPFYNVTTLKPLKTLRFQGFSVISEGLKGLQKIQILRFRDLHTQRYSGNDGLVRI